MSSGNHVDKNVSRHWYPHVTILHLKIRHTYWYTFDNNWSLFELLELCSHF